jgi:hypothetical protein
MSTKRIVVITTEDTYNFQVDVLSELQKLVSAICVTESVKEVIVDGNRSHEFPIEEDIKAVWNFTSPCKMA